jgi:ABC-type antimicrobial peptide transport system permease subunit
MAVALLIGLWVYYQVSYDRFLPGYRQVYKVFERTDDNGELRVGGATPRPLGATLKRDIPEIRYVAQTDWMGPHSLVVGEKKLYSGGAMAGADFLKVFQYPLLKGKADIALEDPYSIVLTASMATALFGAEEPMNRMVRIDNSHDLKVSGILKDLPGNSTLSFNFLVSFSYWESTTDWVRNDATNWRDHSYQTFVALQPDASYAQVDRKLKELVKNYNPVDYKVSKGQFFLHPMQDWHLYTDFRNGLADGGFIDYIKMFSLIGLLVLLIACINFTNLSTARSEKRAREVGVRKAIGSLRRDLILQFLVESLVITFIAALIGCLFVRLALPAFNTLTRSSIDIPFSSPGFWVTMVGYVLLTGLLAGCRPAFYLSSFRPVKVLKSAIQVGKAAALPRKVLVVVQFVCSIALIISTIIVYRQIQYARNRPIGYNCSRLMMTDASNDLSRNYWALKNDLLQSGLVSSVTKSSSPVTDIWSNQRIDDFQGRLPNENLELATTGVSDADYFKTMGMEIKEGRNFTGNASADSLSVILNEAAVTRMRYTMPVNQPITWHDVPQKVRVIGVVKDALMASPFAGAEPSIFIFDPGWSNIITYRLAPTVNTHDAIEKLSAIFSKYNPSYPYLYRFVDDAYASKFSLETLIGTLSGLFAALAILISGLGLFGLAAYMAEQRTKEIGIRKVLGASVGQVWILLSREFVVLVIISCVIASPLSYYSLHDWLLKYPYRITIGPGVFIVAALVAILITILTISWQAIRAAIANPVKSLRAE